MGWFMDHKRTFLTLALPFLCILSIDGHAETPFLSSKAIRIALDAKRSIDGHDERSLQKATENLESLLRESSFRRLEPQAQVQILLWLSKGYERLGKYQEQERLLTSYAKKPELYRFHTLLQVALARSFVQQHRLMEAEHVLERTIGASCAHLALEEKAEIAHVLSFKDEYLSSLLRQADRLAEAGSFSEALKVYETLLPSIERQAHLYQSSPVEKQRFFQIAQLRIAELSFCLGDFTRVITILEPWRTDLFLTPCDHSFLSRRLFLLASAYERIGDEEQAQAFWHEYQSSPFPKLSFQTDPSSYTFNDPNESESVLLWKAKKALEAGSPQALKSIAEALQHRSEAGHTLSPILRSLAAALSFDIPVAVQEAQNTLNHSNDSLHKHWRGTAVHILAECGFTRMMLLACSGQEHKAKVMGQSLLPLLSSSSNPSITLRVSAIHLFLYCQTHDKDHMEKASNLLHTIKEPLSEELQPLFDLLSLSVDGPSEERVVLPSQSVSDRFFASWLRAQGAISATIDDVPTAQEAESPSTDLLPPSDPFTRYLSALSEYQRALSDEEAPEKAQQDLLECLQISGLRDVRPHLYHCLIDLAAHTGQAQTAYNLIWDLIQEDRDYPALPQAILTTIFTLDAFPALATQRATLCNYIFERKSPDIYTLLLSLHLMQTASTPPSDHPSNRFEYAVAARNEGRSLAAETQKSKEPSQIKEQLQQAMKAFDTARLQALESIYSFHDSSSLSMLWSFVITTDVEQIELLERHIPGDNAFNELPALLEGASLHLRDDVHQLKDNVPAHCVHESFLASCQTLIQTTPIFAQTFHRELDSAIATAGSLNDPTYKPAVRSLLYLAKTLREAKRPSDALRVLSPLKEKRMTEEHELALEIAMEKSLCFREMQKPDKAMALLAWIINGPYVSSLRIKAMILRADLYLLLHRRDLAIRQLDSVVAKGGEWGAVAERKLRELYGTD